MGLPRVRRYWRLFAGLGSLGALSLMFVYLYPPVYQVISFLLGRPHFDNCSTAIKAEGPLDGSTYRITEHDCPDKTMYVVFLLPSNSPIAVPLLHSVDSPVPEAVRQQDARSYEIVLADTLPDGQDRLTVKLDSTGFPERYYGFVEGREEP
jgi:hypothetical protein